MGPGRSRQVHSRNMSGRAHQPLLPESSSSSRKPGARDACTAIFLAHSSTSSSAIVETSAMNSGTFFNSPVGSLASFVICVVLSVAAIRVVWCHLRPDDTDDHSRGVLVMVMSLALRSAFLLNSISMPIARSPGRSRLSTTGEVRRLGRFRGSRCEVGVRGRRRFGPLPMRYNCRCGGRTRMPLLWTRRGAVGW